MARRTRLPVAAIAIAAVVLVPTVVTGIGPVLRGGFLLTGREEAETRVRVQVLMTAPGIDDYAAAGVI